MTRGRLPGEGGFQMTILAFAYTPERVLLAADSGVVHTAADPMPDPQLPQQVMGRAPKLFQVGQLPLVWGLCGDGADIRPFREWVEGAPLDSWSSFAGGASEKVLALYEQARARAHRVGPSDAQGSAVVVGGTIGGELHVVSLAPDGRAYFAATHGQPCGAVGPYAAAFGVAGSAALEFAPDLSLDEPRVLERLVGVFCDRLPGLERPAQGWSVTKAGATRFGGGEGA